MFGLIAGAIGTGLSLLQGRKDSKNAKQASDKSLAMQSDQLAFDKKRYEDTQKAYQPIENNLLALGKQGVVADYDGVTSRAIADVNEQFANSEAARLRQMQRMGVNPNSGRADAMGRQLALTKALASAGTINGARRDERYRADNLTWDRLYNLNSLGANKMNGAANSLSNSQTNLSNQYANRAAASQSQSNALFGAAGQLAGNVLSNEANQAALSGIGSKVGGWLSGLGA